MPYSLPVGAKEFVLKHIRAFDQLEVLILVSSDPEIEWTVNSVFKTVQSSRAIVEERLEGFIKEGFLIRGAHPGTYKYVPTTEELHRQIAEVAAAYRISLHRLVELIYSRPSDPLQAFSDAFRFKRDP